MNSATLNKILGALLTGAAFVIWWFIQAQVSINTTSDQRIDDLTSHVLLLEDEHTHDADQIKMLWQRIGDNEGRK